MSAGQAFRVFRVVGALIALMTAVDTGFGFILGYHTIAGAFLHSGPLEATLDILFAAIGAFVGVPTLVRAVVIFYERRRT